MERALQEVCTDFMAIFTAIFSLFAHDDSWKEKKQFAGQCCGERHAFSCLLYQREYGLFCFTTVVVVGSTVLCASVRVYRPSLAGV